MINIFLVSCTEKEPQKPLESKNASLGEDGYTYKITVGKMQFSWKILDKNISVQLKGETSGWIGIGFNPTEGMKDANFIMGYVKDGTATLSSQYGISKMLHKGSTDIGGKDYILNPSGSFKDKVTEIKFEYPLSTGDKLDRPIKVNEDTTVLLAYGSTTMLSHQHMSRSKLVVNLSNGKYSLLVSN